MFQSVRLSRLDVCNVPMVDYPAQSLSKALLTSRLTVLHLHNAQLSGMPLYALGTVYTHTHTRNFSSLNTPELRLQDHVALLNHFRAQVNANSCVPTYMHL